MTDFHAALADYLVTRRAMGYKLTYQAQMLSQFVAYLDAVGAEHLTLGHAVAWAKQPSTAARVWWAVRLSTELDRTPEHPKLRCLHAIGTTP